MKKINSIELDNIIIDELKTAVKNCAVCNKEIKIKSNKQKYCSECAEKQRKEYRTKYNKSEEGKKVYQKAQRKWRKENIALVREITRKSQAKYRKTEKGLKYKAYHRALYRKRYPLKYNIPYLVHMAVKKGIITKDPCKVCKTTKDVQAHHYDYSKPLDVIWLCRKHHNELHLKLKESEVI